MLRVVPFLLLCFIILGSLPLHSQVVSTRYCKDRHCFFEVSPKKAKYIHEEKLHPGGIRVTELRDAKNNEVLSREAYRGDEQYGIWIVPGKNGSDTLDYNFELPRDTCAGLREKDSLENGLKVLTESGEELIRMLVLHVRYPMKAMELEVSGKVYLRAEYDSEGKLQRLFLCKGQMILAKEAARVVRKYRIIPPELFEGKEFSLHVPVKFTIR